MSVHQVATVAGAPVPVDAVDAREELLRNGTRASALPASGTSEGRQLRRWLTQLIVTERVIAAEATARGVTAEDAPTEAELLPDVTARLEIGSIAAAALADPRARALFADDHRRRRRQRRRRRRLPLPQPVAVRAARSDRHGWRTPPDAAPPLEQVRPCDHRASTRRCAATGIPGVAGRPPRRAGRSGPRLRAPRRSAPTRQHPPALIDAHPLSGHRRHQDRRRPGRPRRRVGAYRHGPTPPAQRGAEQVWAAIAALIADALDVAGRRESRAVGIASAGPIDLPGGTVSPINIAVMARFSVARPDRGRGARRAGTTGRRRRVHGARRALAWRRPGRELPVGHGGVDRRRRRVGARRRAVLRPHRQRRPRRPRGRRPDGRPLLVRRPRLRRDRRIRPVDDALGARQRLVGAARRRRQGAGRRGGGWKSVGAAGVSSWRHRAGSDDRFRRRGLRPGSGSHRRGSGQVR